MKVWQVWRVVGLGVAGVILAGGNAAAAADRTNAPSHDEEQEIRALVDRLVVAANAKDVESIMKTYVRGDELFVFDMGAPRHLSGWDACKRDWQDFFNGASDPKLEVKDLSIRVVGEVAYSHGIMHSSWTRKDGSHQELMASVSDVYRKIDGNWLIVQDHWSVPVSSATGRAEWMMQP